MKQLLEFIPLVIFFVCYKVYDIHFASGALIVATALPPLFTWVKYRKVDTMAIVTFLLVLLFGTLTLIFHNDMFIKCKVTVFYTLLSLVLILGQLVFKKNFLQHLLGKNFILPEKVWHNFSLAWAMFFLLCGLINIYIAFWLSQSIWVNFKVFGLPVLTLLFSLISGLYIYRHVRED